LATGNEMRGVLTVNDRTITFYECERKKAESAPKGFNFGRETYRTPESQGRRMGGSSDGRCNTQDYRFEESEG
jgi:hypothetical protein